MKPIVYLIETIVCSGILYLFYHLFLDRKASFDVCRGYLMATIIISAVIPALRIPVYTGDVIEVSGGTSVMMTPLIGESSAARPVTMNDVIAVLYGIGAMTAIALLIYRAIRIGRFKRNAGVGTGNFRFYTLYESGNIETPFSYFRSIFIPPGYSKTELEQIISHEISHIRHHHTEELILMEIFKSLLWFNPFVWMVRRTLTEVHEYQADRDALNAGCDPETYRILVFKQLFGCNPDLTSGLNHSRTKKRLIMMTKKSTGRRHTLLRTATVFPVLAALVMLFGFTKQGPVYVEIDPQQGNGAVSEEIVPAYHIDFKKDKTEDRALPDEKKQMKIEMSDSTLIIIDGKQSINIQQMEKLELDQIESITVIKQSDVTANGEAGKNKASISITMKEGNEATTVIEVQSDEETPDNGLSKIVLKARGDMIKGLDNDVLIIIDGNPADMQKMEKLDSNQIQSITVLKGQSSTEAYGEAGKNGVIIITTKQAGK